MLDQQQEEYVKENLTKCKNCNSCKHVDDCQLDLTTDNIHPDKYVCKNWEKQERGKGILPLIK